MVRKKIEELTIDDMKPLTISWKYTQEDFELFKWIYSHSGYSGFVKDTLRSIMNKSTEDILLRPKMPVKEEKTKKLLDLNF